MARKPKKQKVSREAIKAAAERAEKRSKGEDIVEPKAPITPPITPAAEITAPKKPSRATKYTPEIGRIVCELLAEGRTLTSICRDLTWLPTDQTIRNWALDPEHPFSSQYTRAREVGYHAMADQMVDISDENINDTYMDEDGSPRVNHDVIARSKLRFDARKWLLSKALPKIYGDKLQTEHSGKIEQMHSESPQPTGDDHLADITKRYAGKLNGHSLNGSGPKANGKGNGSSGLH